MDWLHAAASGAGDEHYGYKAFMDTVDAIVMGRHTYQKVRGFDKWPYDKPVVVLASSPMEIPPGLRGSVEWLSGLPAEILRGVTRQTPDGLVES